ncbi:unnamed protein product [Blepharisma stoltei]|uniref:Uncharacterized protein n=1 Tax=Blepharisma stoltei TaxID=1481888 RepID=A0AAU9JDU0_9CILI|nr:unnamed protein product [Blepharisma stoltei]
MIFSPKSASRSKSFEIDVSKSQTLKKSTLKTRSIFRAQEFDIFNRSQDLSPDERAYLKTALASPKYEKMPQLYSAMEILKERLKKDKNNSPSQSTSFHRFSHNSPKSEKLGPGYYEKFDSSFGPSYEFSNIARSGDQVNHKILSFRYLKRSLTPDRLESILKHTVDLENYWKSAKEKTKAHNEKVYLKKMCKVEGERKEFDKKRRELRIKYDQKLIKIRKLEAMVVKKNWLTVFSIYSSLNTIYYRINNRKILKSNSKKWLYLLYYFCKLFGNIHRKIKKIRKRIANKAILGITKITVTWIYRRRQEFLWCLFQIIERCKTRNTLYLMMFTWLGKISEIQRFFKFYRPILEARKKCLKLLWEKVWKELEYDEFVVPRRLTSNNRAGSTQQAITHIEFSIKEKYMNEYLHDRLKVQARMMSNYVEMSRNVNKKFRRHMGFWHNEASIQGFGRNLVMVSYPKPYLKLYSSVDIYLTYIKRAKADSMIAKEISLRKKNPRYFTVLN